MAEGWDDACVSGVQPGGVFLPDSLFPLWLLQSQRPFCSVAAPLTFAAVAGLGRFRRDPRRDGFESE